MNKEETYIKLLNMIPHPEGGYFAETYLSNDKVNDTPLYSSIYFLLHQGDVSHLHRLQEDELWYYHDGNSLDIVMIDETGKLNIVSLGKNVEEGDVLQYLVPKGCIFGSMMKNEGYSLVGCMVSPAFSYEHFELFTRSELLKKYPEHTSIITKLTLDD